MKNVRAYITVFMAALFVASSVFPLAQTSAINGNEFNAGNIIADGVFYNGVALTVGEIESFLAAKVPSCDTSGSQASTHYNSSANRYYTRAEWGTLNGNPAPYTCLKDYRQTVSPIAADSYCQPIAGGSSLTSPQIIMQISQACSLSPKVMLILLQKEQGLVTDEWPWSDQYRAATGFGCPDTAPCDQEYAGFFNQVYRAARQYQIYKKQANSFNYRANGTFFVGYNPNASCGGSSVLLQNQATAGLYNYTPYQPNAAALANLNGTGNSCSAYGNRNFWRDYNNWFGSTQYITQYGWNIVSQEQYSDSARTQPLTIGRVSLQAGQKAYLRIRVQNVGLQTWQQSNVRLGTANPYDQNSPFTDSSWLAPNRVRLVESSVTPGNIGTFEFSVTGTGAVGSYRQYFNMVAENVTWFPNYGLYYPIDITTVQPPVTGVKTELTNNATIAASEPLLSPGAQQALTLQPDGNVVLLREFRPIWSSGTTAANATRLVMQSDGNLVAYTANYGVIWASNTGGHPGARLVMQSDGNVVIYSTTQQALWSTDSMSNPELNRYVTHTTYPGTILQNQKLKTADNTYRLVFQSDGNLVMYGPQNRAIWATGTDGKGAKRVLFQSDGNMVVYDGSSRPVWASNTSGNDAGKLTLQQDGNLVIYNSAVKPVWASNTAGLQ